MFVFQFNFEGSAKDYLIKEEVKAARMARLIVFFLTMIPAIAIGIDIGRVGRSSSYMTERIFLGIWQSRNIWKSFYHLGG